MDRYLGMGFSYNEDTGAMTCSMYHAVVKILASCRTDSLPVQPTPYTMDIFHPSTDLTSVDSKSYQSVTGGLIWLLKLRIEIQLAVIMACTHNSAPTQGDLIKLIRILAYLKGAADLRPTFYTTDGPVLIASTDVAFAVHTARPMLLISHIQKTKITINPTHSEYNAFHHAVEHAKFYRTYLNLLGYPQTDPTPLETDCAPAISIMDAPDFPKNSKNLLVQDRNVRAAYRDHIISPVHVKSAGFATDLNAKPSGPTDFTSKRATLLNIAANPDFAHYL
jgi:hypothetical protein